MKDHEPEFFITDIREPNLEIRRYKEDIFYKIKKGDFYFKTKHWMSAIDKRKQWDEAKYKQEHGKDGKQDMRIAVWHLRDIIKSYDSYVNPFADYWVDVNSPIYFDEVKIDIKIPKEDVWWTENYSSFTITDRFDNNSIIHFKKRKGGFLYRNSYIQEYGTKVIASHEYFYAAEHFEFKFIEPDEEGTYTMFRYNFNTGKVIITSGNSLKKEPNKFEIVDIDQDLFELLYYNLKEASDAAYNFVETRLKNKGLARAPRSGRQP